MTETAEAKKSLTEQLDVKPFNDRLVVKRIEDEEKTSGGIVLPDSMKEKPYKAKVLAVGPGRFDEKGNRQPMEAKVGDTVMFSKHAGTEITIEGEDYLVITERDVLAGL